jgi:hypothetical protein
MVAVGLVASAVLAAQQTPQVVRQDESRQGFSYRVAFGGNGRWLAEGAAGPVRIFNVETGQIIRTVTLPNFAFSAFATHPSADVIALGAADGTVVTFDVSTGNELWRTPPLTQMPFLLPGHFILEFSADGAALEGTASAMTYGLRVSAKEIFGSFFRRRSSGVSEDASIDVFIRVTVAATTWSTARHRSPPANGHKQLVEMPRIADGPTPEAPRVGEAECLTPMPHDFVRHGYAAWREEVFDVAETEGKPVVEPDDVADNGRREPVPWVTEHVVGHPATVPRSPQVENAG